jgi:TRAP-type C4-dicarboxylate transport system permease small subunit
MFSKIDRFLSGFEDTVLVLGTLSVTAVLFINIILRFVFKSGLVWADEFARYVIIWIVMGGAGAAVRRNAHLRITTILDVTRNEAFKRRVNIMVTILSMVFSIFLLIWGSRLTHSMIINRQSSPAMEIPLWWIYISIPLGGLLMTIRYAQSLVKLLGDGKGGSQ